MCRGVPYLVIFQDKTEASGNSLERTKGVPILFDPIEQRFGRGYCDRLPVHLLLTHRGAEFPALVEAKVWVGGAYDDRWSNQTQQLKQTCSRTTGFASLSDLDVHRAPIRTPPVGVPFIGLCPSLLSVVVTSTS